eukprot:Tamp_07904.p2 GENE.Tamp_07904~~Tamp_07904.p2  ORF type:complete len:273 (-),score=42.42 Tamp_07904:1541-2359(-)
MTTMGAGLHAEADAEHSAASAVRDDAGESGAQPEPPAGPCWQVHRWGRSSQAKLALALAVVTAIVLFWTLGKREWIEDFGRWSETHRVEGAFGLAGIYSIAAVLLVPALLLTIIAGFILGLPVGCCAVIVGATLGACLAFVNSRFLLKSWVDENLVKRYPQLSAFNEVIRKNEFYVVFLLRLSPLVPYNALNYCLGVMPVGFVPYLFASFFGMIPGTLLFVYIGSTAANITDAAAGKVKESPLQQVLFWIGLALTILLTLAGSSHSPSLRSI